MALLVHRPSSGYLVPQRISVAEQPAPGHSAAEQRDFRASGRGVPVGVQHREPPLHDLYGRSEVTVCDEFLSFRQVGLRCLPLFIVILLSFYCHFSSESHHFFNRMSTENLQSFSRRTEPFFNRKLTFLPPIFGPLEGNPLPIRTCPKSATKRSKNGRKTVENGLNQSEKSCLNGNEIAPRRCEGRLWAQPDRICRADICGETSVIFSVRSVKSP